MLRIALEPGDPAPAGGVARDAVTSAPSARPWHLGAAFAQVAGARGAHPAIETRAGQYSYDWLLRAALAIAARLGASADFAPGAIVAIDLPNGPAYVAAYYGALLADGVAAPLPAAADPARRRKLIALCAPSALITDSTAAVSSGDEPVTVLNLSSSHEPSAPMPALTRRADDLAMILFTSGSTGEPKGVMLSHRNLLANARAILGALPVAADDRCLCVLPFGHAYGNSILQTHVLRGATLLIQPAMPFPTSIVQAIRDLRATSFSAVPDVFGMLLKYGKLGDAPLASLRYMTVAGGRLRDDLCLDVARRIAPAPFFVMYGQSEATARLAVLPPDQLQSHVGSIGRPVAGVDFRIVDEAGKPVTPGDSGMLCARGDNIMMGYWQDAAGTAEILSPDGWLKTGDLAHQAADGAIYLDGRANLLVKVQGHRVHPAELESVVEIHHPHVAAAAIPVPVAAGDDMRFVLFVAPRDAAPADADAIAATCRRELAAYKVPARIEVLERLPMTSGHKIDRAALTALATRPAGPAA